MKVWNAGEKVLHGDLNANFASIPSAISSGLNGLLPNTLNVTAYGTVGDGIADDTAAIQAALAAMVSGDTLILPPGIYKVSSTLHIGNGASNLASSLHNVRICGVSPPNCPPNIFAGMPTSGQTTLKWAGGATPMIQVCGPLVGWSLRDLALDGNNVASAGIDVLAAAFGDCANLSIYGVLGIAILERTYPAVTTGGYPLNSLHNAWTGIVIDVPQGSSPCTGIALTGQPAATSNGSLNATNCCYARYDNVMIRLPSAGAAFGVYLAWTDSNLFTNLQIINGNPAATSVFFDYTSANNLPAGNGFVGLDVGTDGGYGIGFGSAGAAENIEKPNWIRGQSEINGGYPPHDIPNLVPDLPQVVRRISATGLQGGVALTDLYTPHEEGLFRISFYLHVRVASGAGTIIPSVTINSNGAALTLSGTAAPASATGATQSSLFFKSANAVLMQYQIAGAGLTTLPTYDYAAVLERVG